MKKFYSLVLATGALLLGITEAAAESGFSGTVGVGAMVIDSGNNLNPNGSKALLNDLSSSADRETTVIPLVVPRLKWDIGAPEGAALYLVTDPPIDEVGSFAFTLGGTYDYGESGILDTSIFFTPFEEVYEDPYLVGVDRRETDQSNYGVSVGMRRIGGTGLRVDLVWARHDVDEDLIGVTQPLLARDGDIYSLNVKYAYQVSQKMELRPAFSVRYGDFDGEAQSYTKYKVELGMRYQQGKMMFSPSIYYSHRSHDETHPIFGKTRDNDSYGAALVAIYRQPFGWQDWSVVSLLGVSKGDSNIDFYDTEAANLGFFLNYRF